MTTASTPSKAPSRAISSLPPPPSSAGVPSSTAVPGTVAAGQHGVQAEEGADRGRADDVVPAAVPDAGQRVVLGEHRDRRAAAAGAGPQRGVQAVHAHLGVDAVRGEQVGDRAHRPVLGVALLRVGVQVVAEPQQLAAGRLDRLLGPGQQLLGGAGVRGGQRRRGRRGPLGRGPQLVQVGAVGRERVPGVAGVLGHARVSTRCRAGLACRA